MATTADAAEIAEVWARSISELCGLDHGGDPALIATWCADKTPELVRDSISREENLWLVAVDGGNRIRGFGSLSPAGHVVACYVDPEMVQEGIGTSLLEAIELEALRRGYTAVSLQSTRTAQPFYARHGFVSAGPAESFRGIASYPMRKILRGAGA